MTKLTDQVQVGLWYETKAGATVKITDYYRVKVTYESFHNFGASNGFVYSDYGRANMDNPTPNDLIRCLGVDPFKQVQQLIEPKVGQTWKNKKGETYKIASMCENSINFFGGGLTLKKGFTDNYKAAINAAPKVEPVVPLKEMLELLELEAENSRVKGGMYVGIACRILIGAIKKKYGGGANDKQL